MSTFTSARRSVVATMRLFFWLHPEWWSVALCGFAWLVMLVHGSQYTTPLIPHGGTYLVELQNWLLMVAAMMLCLILDSIRATATGSLWARRQRAIGGFLVGYFAPWLVLGLIAAELRRVSWFHLPIVSALSFAGAALWQLTSAHKRAVAACHRRCPLAPLGWQADRDCLLFGTTIGLACVTSCWALMLACAFTGHGLIAMAGGFVVSAAERLSFRPRRRVALWGTVALGVYYIFAIQSAEWCMASLADQVEPELPWRHGERSTGINIYCVPRAHEIPGLTFDKGDRSTSTGV